MPAPVGYSVGDRWLRDLEQTLNGAFHTFRGQTQLTRRGDDAVDTDVARDLGDGSRNDAPFGVIEGIHEDANAATATNQPDILRRHVHLADELRAWRDERQLLTRLNEAPR